MDRLKDKRTLITGGTTGIGLETAREFLAEGARVAITGKNPVTLEAARKELGADVLIIESDASDAAAQPAVAATLKEKFGGLDAAFINAGVAELRPIDKWDAASFDRTFNINVKGPFFLIQALLPILANPSSIVITASVNAHVGMANTSVLRRIQSRDSLIHAHNLGRTRLARHPRQRRQPRPDHHAALRQTRPER
jgi:NAD(P)-dependent dehydrogenase (short-subunit alcohol dehydrogenase family)